MTSLLTINHYINEVNTFIENVESTNNTFYVYTARPYPWANSSGGNDDSAVQDANGSIAQVELDVYNELAYGKLVANSDVIHVAPRYNWVANTVYARYDQNDPALYTKNFYVVTAGVGDEYNVYKCIDNANGVPSTIKPAQLDTEGTFQTGDGYVWKYMYTIDSSSNSKFTSANFIPVVPNTAVQNNAVAGTIDVIRIATAGNGYSIYETGLISQLVDNLTIKLPNTSSSVDNHYVKSSIYLKSGFGAGQVREIISYNGTTKNATVAEPVNTYIRLDFANSTLVTGGTVGETVRQEIDSLSYTQSVGYFSAGSNVVQTNTGIGATIISANSTVLRVSKFDKDQDFTPGFAIRDLSDTGTLKTDKVNISNNSGLSLGVVLTSGSGYTANANVSIVSSSGTGAVANATANSIGRITAVSVSNSGSSYTSEPSVTVSAPVAQTFNANAIVSNAIPIVTASVFLANDVVTYSRAAGNSNIGIANGQYYVSFANTTHIALATTVGGSNIALTNTASSETGHTIQGQTATARIYPTSMYAVNAAASSTLASEYANGDFFRVGENANTNIRRIQTVNSTIVVVDRPFSGTLASANTYKLSIAMIPDTVSTTVASGTISNTNLNSIRLAITNTSVSGASFILGEGVEFVSISNTSLGANGTVAYSNTSTVYVSGVNGTWTGGQRVRGNSSGLFADIVAVTSNPNVTLKDPVGTFLLGQLVDFRTSGGSNTGTANVVAVTNLSENAIEYQIAPTVSIVGDGTGAVAVSTVNTATGTANAIYSIEMINPGSGYTQANVQVYSNTLYGSGAVVTPVISPILGHGADPVTELGSRYAGITVKFDTSANENWYYPTSVQFRKIGIIKNPAFANCTVETQDYTSFNLTLTSQTGTWSADEVVVQSTTNATGVVVSGNSTILKLRDCRGSFVQSNTVVGLTSGASANVSAVNTVRFTDGETVKQTTTGATATVALALANSTVYLTNIVGELANGAVIQGMQSNAYATISSIKNADGTKDLSTTFADRFNQLSRLAISSNTGAFTNLEIITQETSNASAKIISINQDLDLQINSVSGSFTIGDTITNSNTSANAKCVFANSSYIKLTAVSNSTLFSSNNEINNGLGAQAIVQKVLPVLIVADVPKSDKFITGTAVVTGQTSGSEATISNVTNPDLVRESGKVIYIESSNTVVTRSVNTTEEIRLVIKF